VRRKVGTTVACRRVAWVALPATLRRRVVRACSMHALRREAEAEHGCLVVCPVHLALKSV
jgi:hypothetical protein